MFRYFFIIAPLIIFSCSSNESSPYTNYNPNPQPNYQNSYPYQNQYYNAPTPYYQAPAPYYQPNSRAYSNPYILPQQYASPYYDTDQYYVPPSSYYNIERPQSSGANNKF